MALVLIPRTGHGSPQFHTKFDDFFETVWDKPTDLDAPEPEWKYLSGFAVKKGQTQAEVKGVMDCLLAPQRGQATAITSPSTPRMPTQPAEQFEDQLTPALNDDIRADLPQQPLQDHQPDQTAPQLSQPQPAQQPLPLTRQTRSGRVVKNTPRYKQSIFQRSQGLIAWEVLLDQDEQEDVPTAATQYAIQKSLKNPIAFTASDNPDILYWDQAMKAHDRAKFIEAVGIELDGHERMGNYEPIPLSKVPKGTKLIDMVWSMRRKRRIKTQEVYKWKAGLNVHGGQQEHGVHYWDTYAPVVTWQTVQFFLILSILLGWHSRQLDFVMAYLQAPAEMPLYMGLPQGHKRDGMTRKTHALKLLCNVYGQKQAGQVWNKYMNQGTHEIGFTPSNFDPCLYYRGSVVFLVYIDDYIVFGPTKQAIDRVVTDLRTCSLHFTVE